MRLPLRASYQCYPQAGVGMTIVIQLTHAAHTVDDSPAARDAYYQDAARRIVDAAQGAVGTAHDASGPPKPPHDPTAALALAETLDRAMSEAGSLEHDAVPTTIADLSIHPGDAVTFDATLPDTVRHRREAP